MEVGVGDIGVWDAGVRVTFLGVWLWLWLWLRLW